MHSSTITWSTCCCLHSLRGLKSACRSALGIRPKDYSLWNKLGATQANSSRSQEAIAAYQKALDLKPNYMRAWTNMGIAQARTPCQLGLLSGRRAPALCIPPVCKCTSAILFARLERGGQCTAADGLHHTLLPASVLFWE